MSNESSAIECVGSNEVGDTVSFRFIVSHSETLANGDFVTHGTVNGEPATLVIPVPTDADPTST